MSAKVDGLTHPELGFVPEQLQENTTLYSAQRAASEIFSNYTYPNNKREVQEDTFSNKFYTVIRTINKVIYKTYLIFYSVIEWGMLNTFYVTDFLLGWFLRPLTDSLFPRNPINGKRTLYLLPKIIEKWFGKIMYGISLEKETREFLRRSDSTIAGKVKEIFRKMLQENTKLLNPPDERVKFDYEVRTIPSSFMNAFAYPGGGITILSKLVKEINNTINNKTIRFADIEFPNGSTIKIDLSKVTLDDVLAALLGHEMTHVASRHYNCKVVAMVLAELMFWTGVLFIKRTLGVGEKNSDNEKEFKHLLRDIEEKIMGFILLFQSRKDEYEADVTGIYFAHKAKYSPLGALFLYELFDQNSSRGFNHQNFEFLYTHPCSNNRKLAAFAAINEIDPETLRKSIVTK